jgi:hypothetical protein
MGLLILVGVFVAVALSGWLFGADTRDGRDWRN